MNLLKYASYTISSEEILYYVEKMRWMIVLFLMLIKLAILLKKLVIKLHSTVLSPSVLIFQWMKFIKERLLNKINGRKLAKGNNTLLNAIIIFVTALLHYTHLNNTSCILIINFWIIMLPNFPSSSCWPDLH